MKSPGIAGVLAVLGLFAAALIAGCAPPEAGSHAEPVVGAWYVTIPEAPFQNHVIMFHADGTLLQSNPDAGDPHTSDSNGIGAWVAEGDHVVAKFAEITADRSTHKFVSRGEIAFSVRVQADSMSGSGTAHFFDSNGTPTGDPIPFTLSGSRIRAK